MISGNAQTSDAKCRLRPAGSSSTMASYWLRDRSHMTVHPHNSATGSELDGRATTRARWNKELRLAGICVGCGLVLPALIYLVGANILGAYGGGPHIGSFYGDFFRNLIGGVGRTWFIVLAPYLLLSALRLIFWHWGRKLPPHVAGPSATAARAPEVKERREPFVAP
jgi:hypothetical protein